MHFAGHVKLKSNLESTELKKNIIEINTNRLCSLFFPVFFFFHFKKKKKNAYKAKYSPKTTYGGVDGWRPRFLVFNESFTDGQKK